MKKLFFILLIILPAIALCQSRGDVRGDRVIADQGLFLKGNWADSLMRDTNFVDQYRALPTAGAVAKFVAARTANVQGTTTIKSPGIPSSLLGKNNDLYINTDNKDLYLKALGIWDLVGSVNGSSGSGAVTSGEYNTSATAAQTNFTPGVSLPTDVTRITVSRNGVVIPFTKSSNTIIILSCDSGDLIKIKWVN